MKLYCEVCKENTRQRWNDFDNKFECIRKNEAHGYHKEAVILKGTKTFKQTVEEWRAKQIK